ncbi:MAG: hypothetical protein WCA95_13520 [Opitutaceae bacterium]|jgi:hypothetical protein
MITSNKLPVRSVMVALGCALVLVFAQIPAVRAADPAAQPADKSHSLPLTTTFEKVTVDGVNGYVLNLKNVSTDSLKVNVTVVPSVTFHANAKSRTLPEYVIEAGQVWTIKDLAAGDKVSIASAGFDTLDVTVP